MKQFSQHTLSHTDKETSPKHRQLSLFGPVVPEKEQTTHKVSQHEVPQHNVPQHRVQKITWQLYVDGAARGNPGPAGAGIFIKRGPEPFVKQGFYLGKKTNNQAEYLALILGLCQLLTKAGEQDTIQIFSDSELLIRQVMGVYKVKDAILQKLHKRVMGMLRGRVYTVKHVMREKNSTADALANQGIDKKNQVPSSLQQYCDLQSSDSL